MVGTVPEIRKLQLIFFKKGTDGSGEEASVFFVTVFGIVLYAVGTDQIFFLCGFFQLYAMKHHRRYFYVGKFQLGDDCSFMEDRFSLQPAVFHVAAFFYYCFFADQRIMGSDWKTFFVFCPVGKYQRFPVQIFIIRDFFCQKVQKLPGGSKVDKFCR